MAMAQEPGSGDGGEAAPAATNGEPETISQPTQSPAESGEDKPYSEWSVFFSSGYGPTRLKSGQSHLVDNDRMLEKSILQLSYSNPATQDLATYYLLKDDDLPEKSRKGYALINRVGLERTFGDFGLQFGITGENFQFKSQKNPIHYLLLLNSAYLLPSTDSATGRSVLDYYIYKDKLNDQDPEYYDRGAWFGLTLLDVGGAYHFLSGETLDPYVGAGIRVGARNSRSDSAAYGGYVNAGLRWNINRLYFQTTVEHQSLKIESENHTTGWLPLNTLQLGAGLYL